MLRRQPDGDETKQIKAFLDKGHPWLAFGVKLVPTFKTVLAMLAAIGLAVLVPQVGPQIAKPLIAALK